MHAKESLSNNTRTLRSSSKLPKVSISSEQQSSSSWKVTAKQQHQKHKGQCCGSKTSDGDSSVGVPISAVPQESQRTAFDFRVNILSDPKTQANVLPRYKRKYVPDLEACADYAETIITMCYEQEKRYAIADDYMLQRQAFATWSMREILLDWLVDVNMTMRLTAPSLWLTANLIDRALQKVVDVRRSRIQLVGVGALSLACKQEEIEIPCYRDLVYVTDRTYTKQELMDMEMIILEALHYEVIAPTAHHFLMRYCKLLHASETTRALALYYAERYVQSQGGALCKPSKLAAAALCAALAQRQAQHQPTCSHLTLEELRDCKKNIVVTGVLMRRMWESEDTSEAVRQAVVDAEAAMRDLLPKLAACVDIVSDLDDVQSSAGPSAILANAELWGIPLTLPEVLPSIRPVTTFLELLLATYEFSSLSEKGLIGNLLVNAREHAGVLSAGVTPAAVEIGVQALLRESPFAEGTLCTAEVRQCAAEIVAFVRGARPEAEAGNHQRCHASRRKYARQDPYLAVSALRLPDLVAGGFLPTLPKVGEVVAGGSELEKPAPVSEGSSDIGAQSDL